MSLESIVIFTDGSSRGNPGLGGFAAVIIFPESKNDEIYDLRFKIQELGGREEHTTNNRMELRAAIEALSFIHKSSFINPKSILIYSDSSYLINGITKWVHGWQKNGWKTKEKKDVENRDLWETLFDLTRKSEGASPIMQHYTHTDKPKNVGMFGGIEWKYVGGHVGVAGNVRCDEIATAFADLSAGSRQVAPKLYSGYLPNYSIKNILDIKYDVGAAKEKRASRAHSNAKAYSYVSKIGGVIQTHKTWAECEARVKGKPAKYKKVLSADDERRLIAEWNK